MKRRYLYSVLFIAVLILSSLFLWLQSQPTVLRIGIMAGSQWDVYEGDSYTLLDQTIKSFEQSHPNVHVEYQSGIRPNEYEEWLSEAVLEDDLPDVFLIPSDIFSTMANTNALKGLNGLMDRDQSFSETAYYSNSLAAGKLNETYFALPYQSVPNLMFVNKTLLDEAGIAMPDNDWTWDDFYNICKALTQDRNGDGTIDQFGYYGYDWEDALYSNGVHIYDEENNTVDIHDERWVQALTFMRKLNLLHDEKVSSEQFDKGQVVFCPMNYSDYRTYMPYPWRVKKYANFEWDCLTMPQGPQGDTTSQIDTLLVGMSSHSKHASLAWEFMKALSYDETYQKQLVQQSPAVSVLKEVMRSEDIMEALKLDNPGESSFKLTVLDQIMENGVMVRKTKAYQDVLEKADTQIKVLLENDKDIENDLNLLQRQITTMLHQ